MSESGTHRLLVTVVDQLETAQILVERLQTAGFPNQRIEVVAHDLTAESPEVETPKVHSTIETEFVDGAGKGGLLGVGSGAAAGLLAGLLTGFPGIGLGMLLMGGATGAIVGGMAGLENAEDDTVDLPTHDEYQQLINAGHPLVVVHGTSAEIDTAKQALEGIPYVHQHLHPVRGHEFHEHRED